MNCDTKLPIDLQEIFCPICCSCCCQYQQLILDKMSISSWSRVGCHRHRFLVVCRIHQRSCLPRHCCCLVFVFCRSCCNTNCNTKWPIDLQQIFCPIRCSCCCQYQQLILDKDECLLEPCWLPSPSFASGFLSLFVSPFHCPLQDPPEELSFLPLLSFGFFGRSCRNTNCYTKWPIDLQFFLPDTLLLLLPVSAANC